MKALTITEIQITPIKPSNGLVAFASAVINHQFYVGNIAVYTAPSKKLGHRLVFPTKKLANGKNVDCFYPINKEVSHVLSKMIIDTYIELMENFHHVN